MHEIRYLAGDIALLVTGCNLVVAGGIDSPLAFSVLLGNA